MKKNKNITFFLIILILFGLAVGAYVLFTRNQTHTNKSPDSTKRTTSLEERGQKDKKDTNSQKTTPTAVSLEQGTSTVAVPTPSVPTNTSSFPIENSHYKIERTGERSFNATLYGILNSPSQYDEYIAQLRTYKSEVRSYLESRFGKDITIIWSPSDANSL